MIPSRSPPERGCRHDHPRNHYAGGVAAVDPSEELKNLDTTMGSIEAVLDLDKIRADIAVLEEEAAAPTL